MSPADPEEPEGASQPKLCHAASHTVRLRYRKGNQTACGSVPVTTNTNQCGLLERRESRWEILKDDIYILHLFFQGSILSPFLVNTASFRVLFNFLNSLSSKYTMGGDGDPMIRI